MPELQKRINQGWVLMDSQTLDGNIKRYVLTRGKLECAIELGPDGRGFLYTNNKTRRI